MDLGGSAPSEHLAWIVATLRDEKANIIRPTEKFVEPLCLRERSSVSSVHLRDSNFNHVQPLL